MFSDILKVKMVFEKVFRRCVIVVVNKIKIMSNLKETILGLENVWIRKSSRKLFYRNVFVAVKKKLLNVYKEDDIIINFESEKELEDIYSKMFFFRRFRFWKEKV